MTGPARAFTVCRPQFVIAARIYNAVTLPRAIAAQIVAARQRGRLMITGFDHVAITVADLDVTCNFYCGLLGARVDAEYEWNGRPAVRRVFVGGALLNLHQRGNGIDLVARLPTPGSADLCFRWAGPVAEAEALLRAHEVEIVEGPSARTAADGRRGASVYFKDPDGNLLELLAE
jgi:catechol 2,3-dioxygenase-like lactoylglutathione lyase family enzyme